VSAPIVFLDTETTSLRHDRRAWEIGLITRYPGRPDKEHSWFVDIADLDLGNADLMSLKVGRFHERHPQADPGRIVPSVSAGPEEELLRRLESYTRGAHLVGAVVSFDAEVLAERMRWHGICPSWHYHLIDIEAMAVGYLHRERARDDSGREMAGSLTALPWNSDALSRAVSVNPDGFNRHAALGDAKWARAIYDAITGGTP
jgi:DNA polymerase III epsilon subunit-like protein